MRVVGLTGGIGSGKSTVARFMAEMGAVIVDADRVGHEAFKAGTELWQQVTAAFGKGILAQDGDIDREKLGKAVFDSPEALEKLNRIMHPAMRDIIKAQVEEYRRQGAGVVVVEAPLLVEAGWTSLADEVWVTTATEAAVLRRLRERTGMTEQESLARIRSQLPSQERLKHADVIIDTDCDLQELKARVKELWQKMAGKST